VLAIVLKKIVIQKRRLLAAIISRDTPVVYTRIQKVTKHIKRCKRENINMDLFEHGLQMVHNYSKVFTFKRS